MKIVHVTNSDLKGGAAQACYRMHKSLLTCGAESYILTHQKLSADSRVVEADDTSIKRFLRFIRRALDYLSILLLSVKHRGRFTFPYIGTNISSHHLIKSADIVILHWVHEGFLSLKSIKQLTALNKPVIWFLHDMWAFTGGCHYAGGCEKFLTECGNCPSLNFKSDTDFSNKIFNSKRRFFPSADISVLTPSRWLAEEAGKSFLLKNKLVKNIPNPIDTHMFSPKEKDQARKALNLPADKFLILFVSMTVGEERKGFSCLIEALNILYNRNGGLQNSVELVVLGAADDELINKIPFKTNLLGRLSGGEKISLCYSAADLFAAPSLEDNLPNTVLESLSCGTPVTAFNVGGMPDMVEHKKNGYLAALKSSQDLADGIFWVFKQTIEEKNNLNRAARNKVLSEFTPEIVGGKVIKFCEEILNRV